MAELLLLPLLVVGTIGILLPSLSAHLQRNFPFVFYTTALGLSFLGILLTGGIVLSGELVRQFVPNNIWLMRIASVGVAAVVAWCIAVTAVTIQTKQHLAKNLFYAILSICILTAPALYLLAALYDWLF